MVRTICASGAVNLRMGSFLRQRNERVRMNWSICGSRSIQPGSQVSPARMAASKSLLSVSENGTAPVTTKNTKQPKAYMSCADVGGSGWSRNASGAWYRQSPPTACVCDLVANWDNPKPVSLGRGPKVCMSMRTLEATKLPWTIRGRRTCMCWSAWATCNINCTRLSPSIGTAEGRCSAAPCNSMKRSKFGPSTYSRTKDIDADS
mmetsp:Transcript_18555/g.55435  ORF Transcript_18555/g.55435 Transcript_18555/m.55435 type:complete len:205 (+) Transcript_18555:141-755(+)